jgi:hypothetical protein
LHLPFCPLRSSYYSLLSLRLPFCSFKIFRQVSSLLEPPILYRQVSSVFAPPILFLKIFTLLSSVFKPSILFLSVLPETLFSHCPVRKVTRS